MQHTFAQTYLTDVHTWSLRFPAAHQQSAVIFLFLFGGGGGGCFTRAVHYVFQAVKQQSQQIHFPNTEGEKKR